jgi:predicted small secreted protein
MQDRHVRLHQIVSITLLLICAATVVRGCSTLRGIVKEGPATLDYMPLQPLKGADPVRSLRHALKRLLRDYGQRCLSVQAEARDEAHNQEYRN